MTLSVSVTTPTASTSSARVIDWLGCSMLFAGMFLHCPIVRSDDRGLSSDLVTPEMSDGSPKSGRRVRVASPEYVGTDVYHALYLPQNWEPRGRYPVIVEYTGNKHPVSGSSGEVKDANLGYGISGGRDYIWVSMPYIEQDGKRNATTWWGD